MLPQAPVGGEKRGVSPSLPPSLPPSLSLSLSVCVCVCVERGGERPSI